MPRVIFFASSLVMKHAVRFIKRLHVFFGAAAIRMESVRGTFIQTLDFTRRSVLARAQDFVIVTCAVQVRAL